MNLIPCGESCVYQVDGYCQYTAPTAVRADQNHGCCFYKAIGESATETTSPAPFAQRKKEDALSSMQKPKHHR